MSCLESLTKSLSMILSKLWEVVQDREAQHAAVCGLRRVGHDLAA